VACEAVREAPVSTIGWAIVIWFAISLAASAIWAFLKRGSPREDVSKDDHVIGIGAVVVFFAVIAFGLAVWLR
jgi:hypothetical protein